MKKQIAIIGILVLFTGSLLTYSCKKEITVNDKSNNKTERLLNDQQLEKKILSFKSKIDQIRSTPSLKTGNEPMPLDSAIWYIEATSNYTYGDGGSQLESFVVDSSFIEVPMSNGEVLWSDVQVAYDQVIDSLSAHNDEITASEKQLIVADISLKEVDENNAVLEVTSGFGTDTQDCGLGLTNSTSWYWGWEQGRCDGSSLGVGCDASNKIAQLSNYEVSQPIGSTGIYIDPYIVWHIDPFQVPTSQNPYGDYMLFLGYESASNHPCLSTDEIGYYKNALLQIGEMYRPAGVYRSIINYKLDDTSLGGGSTTTVVHLATITYGVWVTSSNPPEEL